MSVVYINVDVDQSRAVAPLYLVDGDLDIPSNAFIQLDTQDGEITFGIASVSPLLGQDSRSGRFIRWDVSPELRGDRLEALATKLLPSLQRVYDGAFEIGEDDLQVALTSEAQAAKHEVEQVLSEIEPLNIGWTADIRDIFDFLDGPPAGLTAQSTDTQIEKLAAELEDEADSEGIALKGPIIEALEFMRDKLRGD